VLGSIAGDGLESTVVSAQGDVKSNDSLARSNEIQVLLFNASQDCGFVEEKFNLLEETGFEVLIQLRAKLLKD